MIAVQILYTEGWQDMAEIVLPIAANYCNKHGYKLCVVCYAGEYYSDFGYNKLRKVNKRFQEGFDYVWCLDLDTLITNHTIKIEDFIDEQHDFFITKDFNGINAGSFIIKKSEWSFWFMDYILSKNGQEGMHCEQDAVRQYMNEFPDDNHIKILPHPSINSYLYENYPDIPAQLHEQGEWLKGDFLLHCPGIGYKKRLQILNDIKEQIIYE